MKCFACPVPVPQNEIIACTQCRKTYHHNCVNITTNSFMRNTNELRRTFKCPPCLNVTSRRRRDDTPVKQQESAPFESNNMSCEDLLNSKIIDSDLEHSVIVEANELSIQSLAQQPAAQSNPITILEQLSSLLDSKLAVHQSQLSQYIDLSINSLKSDLTTVISQLSSEQLRLKDDMAGVKERLFIVEKNNADLRLELSSLKQQSISGNDTSVSDTIDKLRIELNEREQNSLQNDVEITGIPESSGECLGSIVMAVAHKLGVKMEERDLVNVKRVGPPRKPVSVPSMSAAVAAAAAAAAAAVPRPRPIIVQLPRRSIRDEFLKNARVRRGATTADLGLPSNTIPQPFYINERLTKTNRIIFARARILTKRENWKSVWTRDGHVFIKHDDNSKSICLRSEADLNHIFGDEIKSSSK